MGNNTPRRDGPTPAVEPGDDAPAGTPGTGENVCPTCRGSGTRDGASCQACGGTGVVIEGLGGG